MTESLSFVELEQKQHEMLLRKGGMLKAVANEPQLQAFLGAFDLALQNHGVRLELLSSGYPFNIAEVDLGVVTGEAELRDKFLKMKRELDNWNAQLRNAKAACPRLLLLHKQCLGHPLHARCSYLGRG